MAFYLQIENNTHLIIDTFDDSQGTGSWYYEVTCSTDEYPPFRYKYHGDEDIRLYTCSIDLSSVDHVPFVCNLVQNSVIDYKKYREWLKTYTFVNNFYSLSLDEQQLAAREFVVDKSERDTVYPWDEQISYGLSYHVKSIAARGQRLAVATSILFNYLTMSDAKQVIADVLYGVSGSDGDLVWKYEKYGVEGTLEGDADGLFDYIESRTGSAYSGSGLLDKNYTMLTSSIESMSADIMKVLKHGNYWAGYK